MMQDLSPQDRAKQATAIRAAEFVESGMKLGLGTGSTAVFLVREIGRMVREEGMEITAVATSTRTAAQAREEGITMRSLDEVGWLDLTIDGADEFDPQFNLIKGGGGALLHEKLVAMASDRMLVIADDSKAVPILGAFPLPIEVLGFGLASTQQAVARLLDELSFTGYQIVLRAQDGSSYVTDEGNHILDLHLGQIPDPTTLAMRLNQLPGVVENGLFINICDRIVLGYADGRTELRNLPD